jgi:ketosteroid isomerase-like protein
MKRLSGLALILMFVAPTTSWAQASSAREQQLIKVENAWSQAAVARDRTALERFYADEYIFTDEDGVVSTKAKELADIGSGAFQLTSYKFEDMNVRLYGNVAVVTGRNTIQGVWSQIAHDVSGPYRFTDVFVWRGGRWQCVASQASRIVEE